MSVDDPGLGAPTTEAAYDGGGGGGGGRLLSSSRRQSSSPALCMQASSPQLTDDILEDTPPASADGQVAAGSTAAYPGFVPRAFFLFDQTTRPRSWCLRLIMWPYPLLLNFHVFVLSYIRGFFSP